MIACIGTYAKLIHGLTGLEQANEYFGHEISLKPVLFVPSLCRVSVVWNFILLFNLSSDNKKWES